MLKSLFLGMYWRITMRNQSSLKTIEQRLDDFAEFLMTHEFDTAEADECFAQGASIYYIEEDTPVDLLIKEYPSGRKELIEMQATGEEIIIKVLTT